MRRWGWSALLGLLTASSCTRPTQAVMEDVDPYGWNKAVVVTIENADTLTLRDLSVVIRSNRNFRADTLHLEFTLHTPDSAYFRELLALPMSHPHRPASLCMVDEIPYRHNVILNRFGTYHITLRPLYPIKGIEAAGLNIVRAE